MKRKKGEGKNLGGGGIPKNRGEDWEKSGTENPKNLR